MMCLGRVPQVEDQFVSDGLRFEIVDMDQNRVDKLIVSRVGAETTPSHGTALGKQGDAL
jgi:putative hemolysin